MLREIFSDLGLLLMRVVLAATMILGHGLGKIDKLSGGADTFPDPLHMGSENSLYLAIGAEVVCSGLIALGLLTRLALLPLIGTMVVALFVIHAKDAWNVKELAAIYLVAYCGLFLIGPGRISIDHAIWRKKQPDFAVS